MKENLTNISNISTVAWCAASTGELTPEIYASVFEYIAAALNAEAEGGEEV